MFFPILSNYISVFSTTRKNQVETQSNVTVQNTLLNQRQLLPSIAIKGR